MELKNKSIRAFLDEYEIKNIGNMNCDNVFIGHMAGERVIQPPPSISPYNGKYQLKKTCGLKGKDVLVLIKDLEVYGLSCEYRVSYLIEDYDDYSVMAVKDSSSIKML